MSIRVFVHGALVLALAATTAATAAGSPATGVAFSLTPVYHFDGDLDSGGEAGYGSLLSSLGQTWSLDSQSSLGLRLRLDYEDWRFDQPQAFGGQDPWDQLYRVGLSLPYVLVTSGGWRWGFTPTLEYAGESGARFSDALEYGATVSAARQVRPDLTLGLGLGVFYRIEETRAFPFLAIDWRITDRLRLANPLPSGPAGPAGLELSYALNSGWDLGIGGAYRSFRHRLDRDGPFPEGIGEHRFIPVYLRLGHDLTDSLSLDLYAGAAFGAQLRVEDADGDRLFDEDQDPAATLGLSLTGRF